MKTLRKKGALAVAFILAVSMLLGPAQGFFGGAAYAAGGTLSGAGTEESPYLIEDAADLAQMAADVNAGTNASAYYQLTGDIDLSKIGRAHV